MQTREGTLPTPDDPAVRYSAMARDGSCDELEERVIAVSEKGPRTRYVFSVVRVLNSPRRWPFIRVQKYFYSRRCDAWFRCLERGALFTLTGSDRTALEAAFTALSEGDRRGA